MYSSPTTKKQRPATSYLVRPRLGPLRSIFSSKPMSSYSQDKKKKAKKYTSGKMDFRRRPDYADTAYREAVGRLRILLAESYAPIKRPLRELDSAGEDTDNQSMISVTSRVSKATRPSYYHYLSMPPKRYYYPPIRPMIPTDTSEKNLSNPLKFENNQPPELMSFIEKQEEYIEQLEKESRFCREELSSLLSKVKDVISENENLHEKQKSNLMKSVFNHLETETETETEVDLAQQISSSPRKSKKRVLEGPTIVFESRISELEAQLTQAKIDLRKALEDNENYKKKISDGSLLDGLGYDHYKKQLESLQREKEVLQETVAKLQNALSKFRDKENDTCDQVKRSLDAAEQAHYEKNAADLEIRRLKDELDRQHAKLRDAISDQSRRISDERSAVERRYTQQIEQLTTELGVQWETTNKLQLELDKQRRENGDLRRELAQKQAMLDGMKKDMQNKIMSLQSDIGVNGAEKSALEQQIATLQMSNERNERQAKQESSRLQAEMQSLRQRLDRADADLIHSRRENIRLSEEVASLEKEIKLNSALNEEKGKQSGEILALPPPKEQGKQISSLIEDMESKHAVTVSELEGMIHSQNQLMDKLSLECHTLTQKLEDASTRHKEEIRELQTSLNRLNSRLLNQTQMTPSSVKDEDYNSISNKRIAQPQDPSNYDQNQSRDLSRTNSRSSIKLDNTPEKKVYQPTNQTFKDSQPLKNLDQPSNVDTHQPSESVEESYAQQYVDPNNQGYYDDQSGNNEYQYDPNQQYMSGSVDPNQQYIEPNQDYAVDPNQQYMSGPVDPNQQYIEPNQDYAVDPNQQYSVDPNQQYSVDTDQQYFTDPNQQYSAQGGQEYVMDQDQQQYVEDQNYAADANQQYASDPNQQYASDPNQQYASDPNQQYASDPNQQYAKDPNQQYAKDPNQQYAKDPNQQYASDPNQQYAKDPNQQ